MNGWDVDVSGLRSVLDALGPDRDRMAVAGRVAADAASQATSGRVRAAVDDFFSARSATPYLLGDATDRAVQGASRATAAIIDGDEEMARTAAADASRVLPSGATKPSVPLVFRLSPSASPGLSTAPVPGGSE